MQERFLSISDVAELMRTSKAKAASALAAHGIYGIDLGRGRGGGLRFLYSSVVAVMQSMAASAIPAEKRGHSKKKVPQLDLLSMSVGDIYALTTGQNVQ